MASLGTAPTEQTAREIAAQTFGIQPTEVRRFPNGMMHYVFDVTFASRAPVVIRIAGMHGHAAMRGAAHLSRLLRPRGVPLPAILAENLDTAFPHLILERLPGFDLGEVIGALSQAELESIVADVVHAQQATADLPNPTQKFGYAVSAEEAPYSNWSQVLAAHLERSRKRIVAAGLFDVGETAPLSAILDDMRTETASIAATPFLHDTTTKNVIVSPAGRCSGIVDVDDLCFGDPRYVVALTHASLLARGIPPHYTEAWLRAAEFARDRLFQVYIALFLADFMAERGQRFNGNETVTNPDSDQRLRRLYLDTIAEI